MVVMMMVAAIPPETVEADYSLYKEQLAGDVWRIIELKGVEAVEEIGEKTALCIYISGIRKSNCRGESYYTTISTERLIFEGGEVKRVTLSLGPRR